MLRAKIHRARVTAANVDYEGSITIDANLLELAGVLPHEAVQVWNVTNGERFETYAVAGEPGTGVVCVNGAAAHKVGVGDLIIIATFAWLEESAARKWQPRLVFVDARNAPLPRGRKETPGPGRAELGC